MYGFCFESVCVIGSKPSVCIVLDQTAHLTLQRFEIKRPEKVAPASIRFGSIESLPNHFQDNIFALLLLKLRLKESLKSRLNLILPDIYF